MLESVTKTIGWTEALQKVFPEKKVRVEVRLFPILWCTGVVQE